MWFLLAYPVSLLVAACVAESASKPIPLPECTWPSNLANVEERDSEQGVLCGVSRILQRESCPNGGRLAALSSTDNSLKLCDVKPGCSCEPLCESSEYAIDCWPGGTAPAGCHQVFVNFKDTYSCCPCMP